MNTDTDDPRPTARRAMTAADYAIVVQRVVFRVLSRSRNPHAVEAADDVSQEVALALLAASDRLAEIMARYPDPAVYARARAQHAFTQWERAMRVDRGEGARLVLGPDGLLHVARPMVAGDAPLPGGQGNHWDLVGATPDSTDDLVELLAHWPRAVSFINSLAATDRQIVVLVLGYGFQVTEVAARLGLARETVARRLSRIRRQITDWRANMGAEMNTWADNEGTAA